MYVLFVMFAYVTPAVNSKSVNMLLLMASVLLSFLLISEVWL